MHKESSGYTSTGLRRALNQTIVHEAEVASICDDNDDNMVKHLDSKHIRSLGKPPSQQNIILARFGISSRLIVIKDDRCRQSRIASFESLLGGD
jgi:hypothetical protein